MMERIAEASPRFKARIAGVFGSTFLPRTLGALMVFASVGWLTFLSPPLAKSLYPYNFAPGLIGDGSLTLWLLVIGVNIPRWQEQACRNTGLRNTAARMTRQRPIVGRHSQNIVVKRGDFEAPDRPFS
jgi:hypothetical protein